jgi:hypothetical protein
MPNEAEEAPVGLEVTVPALTDPDKASYDAAMEKAQKDLPQVSQESERVLRGDPTEPNLQLTEGILYHLIPDEEE